MNSQRTIIYTLRKNALKGEKLKIDISNMLFDTVQEIVVSNKAANNYKNFDFDLITNFSVTSPISEEDFNNKDDSEIIDILYRNLSDYYERKQEINKELAFPVIKNVFENKGNNYKRIVVPFTDGAKVINISTDLEESFESKCKTLIDDFEKNISLAIIDDKWKDHLKKMDELKQSVQLAVHEQKDPLLIYKFEANELFKNMILILNKELLSFLFKGSLPNNENNIKEATQPTKHRDYRTTKDETLNTDEMAQKAKQVGSSASQSSQKVETIVRDIPKIGRNEIVEIKNTNSGEIKKLKFKKALSLLESGDWIINSH